MKKYIKTYLPNVAIKFYRALRDHIESKRNASLSAAEIFSNIYKENKWGGGAGEFCSGIGSISEEITQPYVAKITQFLQSQGTTPLAIVDLGCGDFRVGQNFIDYCDKYIGVDIVPDLIRQHQKAGYGPKVSFLCLNLIEDKLPDGNVCFLRQVLQHLSNAQISKILPKLAKYEFIFITEHYPTDNPEIVPNKDKVCGASVRLFDNSGVYLGASPFNIPASAMKLFLEVPLDEHSDNTMQGTLRTYLLNGKQLIDRRIQG